MHGAACWQGKGHGVPEPAATPLSLAGGCRSLGAGSQPVPGTAEPPQWPSLEFPDPVRDTAPNCPPWSLVCVITFLPMLLHHAGMLVLSQNHPRGLASHARQGHCPGQGMESQAGDIGPGRVAVLEDTPGTSGVPGCGGRCLGATPSASPLPNSGSHPPNPNSRGFLQPQNTQLISQKPQTLKEEAGGVGGEGWVE